MLADRCLLRYHAHRLWRPHAGGAALVVGLHGVVLALALALDVAPARTAASQPIEVRLIAAPQRVAAAVPEPSVVAVSLLPPPPMPSLLVPDFAIQTAVAPAAPAIAAQRGAEPELAVAAAHERPAGVAAPPAEPVHIQHVAYARFDPPAYPPLSRRLGESGVVVLRVLIDEAGLPREVQVETSSGFARLDEAAVAAVRSARFVPFSEGGRARAAVARVPIRFELT
jgi:protein TonB